MAGFGRFHYAMTAGVHRDFGRISVLYCISIFFVSSPASGQEPQTDSIFRSHFQQFSEMETIGSQSRRVIIYGNVTPDFGSNIEAALKHSEEATEILEQTTEFYMKGAQFRNAYTTGSYDRNGGEDFDYAYNGKLYQTFSPSERALMLQESPETEKNQRYFVPPAILDPYEFVFMVTNETISLDTLKSEEIWTELSNRAQLVGETRIGDDTCIIVDISHSEPRGGMDVFTRAYFAKDKGYFPIRYENYIGDESYCQRIFQASDIRAVETPSGESFFFAASGVCHIFDWYGSGNSVAASVYELDIATVSVNIDLPDSLFTIPPSHAKTVLFDGKPELNFSTSNFDDLLTDAGEVVAYENTENSELTAQIPESSNIEGAPSVNAQDSQYDTRRVAYFLLGIGLFVAIIGSIIIRKQKRS